ncbi:MAG TPA: class I SAM-dependent methyltransferase [Acidimicrobiales bacterium]|nr:class I SAM-dependent methyltransferase [Acidimicrobiales bacterium]
MPDGPCLDATAHGDAFCAIVGGVGGVATVVPEDRNRFAQRLFAPLPRRYDRLAEWLSFGQNGRWRAVMVDHVVAGDPARVLDVASGTAGVALAIARRSSSARVVGVDLTEAMLRRGGDNIAAAGMERRIVLTLGRGEQLPFGDETFDALSFTYLLRYVADPAAAVAELARVLRPGGVMANLEFLVPANPFWRWWWWLYTRLVLPVAGFATGGREWARVGAFLGPSISAHDRRYPVPWTVRAWEAAGMVDVGVRRMSLGGGLVMWGRKGD